MKLLIQGGRVIDPASGFDAVADVAIADGKIRSIGSVPADFAAQKTIDARGCVVAPGLVDLAVRLRDSGQPQEGRPSSELLAAVAGGVTSVVCPPDTAPVLDVPGLVEMLRYRSERQQLARVFPLGALTRALEGEVLTEMVALTKAGCVAFSQAEVPIANTQVLQRALQYASTFGYAVWLRPQEMHLGKGVVASGPLATRMGLSGVPVAAETIALHTIFELVRSTQARVHLCRISSAAGVALVKQAKADGLPVTCDVSINSLHLIDTDIGFFDSRTHLLPPLRQQRDRDALRQALADGTIDALVSDHTPVDDDAKALPFAQSEPGATGLELLLSLTLKWAQQAGVALPQALAIISSRPAAVLASSCKNLVPGLGTLAADQPADVCVFDPDADWVVQPEALRSRGKHTPFSGYALPARVRATVAGGQLAFEA